MKGTKESCTCEECQRACRNKPGWMSPERFIQIVEYLRMTKEEAFEKYFAVDWWESFYEEKDSINDRRGYLIVPAIHGSEGSYYPFNPNGECVFFRNGRCDIHPVKPEECAHMIHGFKESEHKMARERRRGYVALWQTAEWQGLLKELLGEEPQAVVPSNVFEALDWIKGFHDL